MFRKILILSFFCILCVQKVSYANEEMLQSMQQSLLQLQQSMKELQSTVQTQNEVIQRQAIQIDALERASGNPGIGAGVPVSSESGVKVAGIAGFNPEIGVTGTVQAKLTEDTADEEGNDAVALKELELSFAQVVDPYSRLDAILTFNDNLEDQNVDIEEAYYTRWGLPFGFTTQLGKFRSKIGKQNLQHLHQLETADYALVIKDFFGDEGLASSGVRLQNSIPNPWDQPIEITGELLRGNNGNSFSGVSRRPIFNTHVKTAFDMSKDSNLEIGWTTLFGDENPPRTVTDFDENDAVVEESITDPKGQDRYGVKVYGADVTWNWNLSEGRKFKLQNEVYFQNRGSVVHINENPWGFYSLWDYKFSQRWSAGVRFDYLEPLDVQDGHRSTTGISPYLVFWQSEFADFKIQYSHLNPADPNAERDNAVYLTVDFLAGAHKHPVQ